MRTPDLPRCASHAALLQLVFLAMACTGSTEPREQHIVARLEAVTETLVSGVAGTQMRPSPTVRATGRSGAPIPGIVVSFRKSGHGGLPASTAVTDDSGFASAEYWLSTTVGTDTVTARAGGHVVMFVAQAVPGPIAALVAVSGDGQFGASGTALPVPLEALVQDRFANPIRGATVTFEVTSGGGVLAIYSAVSNPDGRANAGSWTLGPTEGIQRVTAHAGGSHVVFSAEACDPAGCQDEILFVRGGNVFRFNRLTRVERPLTSDGNSFTPQWSPDGRRIAFSRHHDVYIADRDGGDAQRVTSGAPFHTPSWSPDGGSLVFAGDWWLCVYYCSIYTLDLTTPASGPRFLAEMAADPAWSPDGGRIAYVSLSGDDGYHALYTVRPDGTDLRIVIPRDVSAIGRPAWSPDGSRLAFTRCLGSCGVYVVNADGSGLFQLNTGGSAAWPTWSPDGTRIAYQRSGAIVYTHLDGGDPVEIIERGNTPFWGH